MPEVSPIWDPKFGIEIWGKIPAGQALKNGLGHNLQHIAPFVIPTTGFCMVFQYTTLVCSTQGTILGPQIPNWDPDWAVFFDEQ